MSRTTVHVNGQETRVWVGLRSCGCCVAVVVDDPTVPKKDIEKTKREFLRDGLSVVSGSWDEWTNKYLPSMRRDCEHQKAKREGR